MPPFGPNDGENTDVSEGDDSVCRKDSRPWGVGGTTSGMLLEKDRSNLGVWIVKPAGFRLIPFGGILIGEAGADR